MLVNVHIGGMSVFIQWRKDKQGPLLTMGKQTGEHTDSEQTDRQEWKERQEVCIAFVGIDRQEVIAGQRKDKQEVSIASGGQTNRRPVMGQRVVRQTGGHH